MASSVDVGQSKNRASIPDRGRMFSEVSKSALDPQPFSYSTGPARYFRGGRAADILTSGTVVKNIKNSTSAPTCVSELRIAMILP